MLKVTKFGGSSLCDSAGFARVREIVEQYDYHYVIRNLTQGQYNYLGSSCRHRVSGRQTPCR